MVTRRRFLQSGLAMGLGGAFFGSHLLAQSKDVDQYVSQFSRRLKPLGRILELENYYVWGCSAIVDDEGLFHLFFSRWDSKRGMGGWINSSEIAHAVADSATGPFRNIETILSPRGGDFFDATTCHNPHIQKVDNRYCLFYIGNANRKTNTKRIALATSDSLYGPWKRPIKPLLEVGLHNEWDNHCTSNPSFLKHPNGQYWLYYKSWNSSDYEQSVHPTIRGNRKYGLAIADNLEGPYRKHKGNPIIDYSALGKNRQLEDAYVFIENGRFYMVARDMGRFDHEVGIILESDDGIHWSDPEIAYFGTSKYFSQPAPPAHLKKYGRFERPQILMQAGHPTHLFVTTQGGKFKTTSPFVFEIENSK